MKKLKRKVILTLLLCVVSTGLLAERQTPPAGGEPKDFKLPALEVLELPNGLRATLVVFGQVPKVQVRTVVRTGNIDEAPAELWLADLLGKMLEEGTAEMDSGQLAEAFAALGGELQVGVSVDSFSLSSGALSEKAPQLIKRLAEVVRSPALPSSELERRKNDLVRQLAVARSQPGRQAEAMFLGTIYGDHPYGRFFPDAAALSAFTLDQVREFYTKNFGAERTRLYVVGGFDPGAMRQAIEEAFGDWNAGPPPTVNVPEVTKPAKLQIHLLDRPGAAQSTIRLGLPVIDPSNPDYLALSVTNALLGGSFSSRITSNIREDKGYTYSPGSQVSSFYRTAVWAERADITTEHTGAALREILFEIDRLRAEPPSREELEGIQNYLSGAFVRANSNPFGIAYQLYYVDLHGLGTEYLTTYVKRVHAVTPEDVQRIARTYLPTDRMVLSVVGDKAKVAAQLEPFGQIVE